MLVFHIGGQEAECVRVPNIRDHGDSCFFTNVDLAVGAFRASYSANFNSSAFSDFLRDLEQLQQTVVCTAVFTSFENQLELTLSGNDSGQIKIRGEAGDSVGAGNKLNSHLYVDQTHLPAILNDLQNSLQQYPPSAI
jgi:hypothetical protein